MNKALLEILVCPSCKGKLIYNKNNNELICRIEQLAFPIRDEIPIMLIEESRKMRLEEIDALSSQTL